MKKLVACIALAFISLSQLQAQDKGTIEIGAIGGINFATVSDIQGNAAKTRVAFNFGASGEYYFSDRWGIKTGLIYDSKGWADGFVESFNNTGDPQISSADFKLNYLTIPVMANWHFGSTRKWYLNFGGYAGFLLNAEETAFGNDVKDGLTSTDFGLALGIGYKFPISDKVKLCIEYQEQFGLVDIFENNTGDAVTNRRSSFNIGALFNLD
ncbi:porin family protein [Kordia algicida OT-1]|uniref:Outer membrane protein beta-barrel domain-containing protein n=1 Tax=Kordia algicida OT-1 TaxID=391587 RepID=A9DUV1_9FLAO|nr:porin family protein [Kordia algicida]EDP96336.1 hypothetical protein KAOT1_02967 [Kordia algicida OT-1]